MKNDIAKRHGYEAVKDMGHEHFLIKGKENVDKSVSNGGNFNHL